MDETLTTVGPTQILLALPPIPLTLLLVAFATEASVLSKVLGEPKAAH